MRLVPFLLSIPLVAAPSDRGLPWESEPEPLWRASEAGTPPPPMPEISVSPSSPRMVHLSSHGVLRVVDERGLVHLRLGLSGRPFRIWRDGGTPITLKDFPQTFPSKTPLSEGPKVLAGAGVDFRNMLLGLLWVLDDAEKVVTIVHPATGQVAYLRLPGGSNLDLWMYSDRLVLREIPSDPALRKEAACWSVPWLGLLPQLLRLATPPLTASPGTALNPFPKE